MNKCTFLNALFAVQTIKMSHEQTHINVECEHKIWWCERSLIFPYAK